MYELAVRTPDGEVFPAKLAEATGHPIKKIRDILREARRDGYFELRGDKSAIMPKGRELIQRSVPYTGRSLTKLFAAMSGGIEIVKAATSGN